jgi:hypothetical protein
VIVEWILRQQEASPAEGGFLLLASGSLFLSQHALKHIKGLLAEWSPLLIMNLAGEFVASCAVINFILYGAFKY